MRALFWAAGLALDRPDVSADEYRAARPLRVHLVGEGARRTFSRAHHLRGRRRAALALTPPRARAGKTSYNPALNPSYRDAFLGSGTLTRPSLVEAEGRVSPSPSALLGHSRSQLSSTARAQ